MLCRTIVCSHKMKRLTLFRLLHCMLWLAVSAPFFASSQNNCARQPEFVQSLQFDMNRSGFSTSDRFIMGIIFAEFKDPANPVEYTRTYQHPSWKQAGYLGTIVFDDLGNIYIAPLPVVNTLNNPVYEKNTIFRIDHITGVMSKFIELPVESKFCPVNPFGIVGLTYDCNSKTIYAATLEGSEEDMEKGKIFSIAVQDKKVSLVLDRFDALGLTTFTSAETTKLFFASARRSKIMSLDLTGNKGTAAIPEEIIDFTGLGPRGDDKARKLRIRNDGMMQIYGVEFEYNLIAPTARQEQIFYYRYNKARDKWEYAE